MRQPFTGQAFAEAQNDDSEPFCSPQVRTASSEQVSSSATVQDTHNHVESARIEEPRTKQESSTAQLERPPTAPGGWARQETADWFDACVERHWAADHAWASNRGLARLTKQDEKTIRQVRDGRKSFPFAMLLVLPAPLVVDMIAWVQKKRALVSIKRALPVLRDVLGQLESPVLPEDREETIDALLDAQERIAARVKRLRAERR